jgi:hypothetical protein
MRDTEAQADFSDRTLFCMAARLGILLYWLAWVAAVLWAVFVLVVAATLPHPDWTTATPVAAVGALVILACGRAARYFLAGL